MKWTGYAMIKENQALLNRLNVVSDGLIIFLTLPIAFWLRFYVLPGGVISVPFSQYLMLAGVLVAVLRHGPADLKKCLDALYAAEMNVNFLYPLLPCVGRGSLVALHVEDLNFGRTVLNSSGIKVLFQQDLSR